MARLVMLVLLLAIGALAVRAPSAYSLVRPGRVYELSGRIQLPDDRRHEAGWLALTAVRVRPASLVDFVETRFEPGAQLLPRAQVRSPDVSESEYERLRWRLMEGAKRVAALVALPRAGYPVAVLGQGLLVEQVRPDRAAAGRLVPGDVLIRADRQRLSAQADLSAALERAGPGRELTQRVLRGGQTLTVGVTPSESPTEPGRAVLGVKTSVHVYNLRIPFAIEMDAQNVGGPSGGLMLALALLDALTPGDLTGGEQVAGTGTIEPSGSVGAVGGVGTKVVAAERAGATIFLAPRGNVEEARRAATGPRVLPVGSFDEAVSTLEQLGGSTRG